MDDIGKIITGFFSFVIGAYVLAELIKALPVQINGLSFGPLLFGVFVFYSILWFFKEVSGR